MAPSHELLKILDSIEASGVLPAGGSGIESPDWHQTSRSIVLCVRQQHPPNQLIRFVLRCYFAAGDEAGKQGFETAISFGHMGLEISEEQAVQILRILLTRGAE